MVTRQQGRPRTKGWQLRSDGKDAAMIHPTGNNAATMEAPDAGAGNGQER